MVVDVSAPSDVEETVAEADECRLMALAFFCELAQEVDEVLDGGGWRGPEIEGHRAAHEVEADAGEAKVALVDEVAGDGV